MPPDQDRELVRVLLGLAGIVAFLLALAWLFG